MISIELSDRLVAVAVFGEFTLADFKEFEEQLSYKIQFSGPIDLLFDCREMVRFTVDVAWEEIKFSRRHEHDFRRIAVVTDDQWITWSAWLAQIFVDARVQVFSGSNAARAWLEAPETPEAAAGG